MDTNPQAFASTANLEYGESHAKGFVLKAESEEIRSRHVEIIRQLLQDFDLDKTKERYQSAHVYKFNVEQTDCSADRYVQPVLIWNKNIQTNLSIVTNIFDTVTYMQYYFNVKVWRIIIWRLTDSFLTTPMPHYW